MAEINWGLIANTPNVFDVGLQGYQAGRQANAQRQRQALIQRQADREEQQYQAGLRQQEQRKAALAAYATDPSAGRQQALTAGDFDLVDQINKLDASQRELVAKNNADVAAFAASLKNAPIDGRKAMLSDPKNVQFLTQRGFTPEQISSFEPTDQALDSVIAQGMKVGEILAQQNADRDFALRKTDTEADNTRADRQFDWQKTTDTKRLGYEGARVGMEGQRLNLDRARLGLEGQRVDIERGKANSGAAKPPTEAQAKDAFSAQRMRGAAQTIGKLEADKSFNPTLSGAGAAVGGSKARQYQSAQLEWADSLLRATTGAAATKEEIENTKRTYFPQFGDSPDVVAQKADARRRVQMDLARRAGPAGAAAMPTGPVRVSTPDEARALPPGTQFITPDGRVKVR